MFNLIAHALANVSSVLISLGKTELEQVREEEEETKFIVISVMSDTSSLKKTLQI